MNIEVTDIQQTSAKLSWSPPEVDGGSEITHYVVEKREMDRKTWAVVKGEVQIDQIPFKVGGLMAGTEYYFRVTAVNQYGLGVPKVSPTSCLASDPISTYGLQHNAFICHLHHIHYNRLYFRLRVHQHIQVIYICVPLGKPDPCEKIEVLEITKNSATVGWVKPMRDGGAKIDGYVVEYIEIKPPPAPPAPVEVCFLADSQTSHQDLIIYVLLR